MSMEATLAAALLATPSDAIVASDHRGTITFWNPGAARIFGYTREEALGQSLDLIIPENLRARHWEGYDKVMQTGESHYGQGDVLAVPGVAKGGRRISIEFTIVMLKDEHDQPSGMAAIMRDVSQRFEETRALRRKLAEATRTQG
jgi:PAS domain S-box-containing protein